MTNEEKKKREEYLDIAKGLLILLVMLLHLLDNSCGLKYILLATTMPAFFSLSGATLSLSKVITKKNVNFISLKVKSLMIPYFFFGSIYFAICIYRYYPSFPKKILFSFLVTKGINVTWFLSTLFWAIIFVYMILRNNKKIICFSFFISYFIVVIFNQTLLLEKSVLLEIITVLIIRIIAIIPFIVIGFFLQEKIERVKELGIRKSILGLLIISLLIIICSKWNGRVDINNAFFGNYVILFYVEGILATVEIFILGILVEKYANIYISRFFKYCGINSLLIMCTHEFLGPRYLSQVIGNYFPVVKTLFSWIILIILELVIVSFFSKGYNIIVFNLGKRMDNLFLAFSKKKGKTWLH